LHNYQVGLHDDIKLLVRSQRYHSIKGDSRSQRQEKNKTPKPKE